MTWIAVGALLLIWWRAGRDDHTTVAFAVLIALVASPIVWLHYLSLLLVPVALVKRSLHWIWLVPVATVFCPGSGDGTLTRTGLALLVVATVVLAAAGVLGEARTRGARGHLA